jgi:hypothetical protein
MLNNEALCNPENIQCGKDLVNFHEIKMQEDFILPLHEHTDPDTVSNVL